MSKEFYPIFGEVPWETLLGRQTASIPPVATTGGAGPAHDVGNAETMVKLITMLVRHEGDKRVEPDDVHAVAASIRSCCHHVLLPPLDACTARLATSTRVPTPTPLPNETQLKE